MSCPFIITGIIAGTEFYPYPQNNIKPLLGSMRYVAYSGFISLGIIENEEVIERGGNQTLKRRKSHNHAARDLKFI